MLNLKAQMYIDYFEITSMYIYTFTNRGLDMRNFS